MVYTLTIGTGTSGRKEDYSYNEFILSVEADAISSVVVYDTHLVGLDKVTAVTEAAFPKDYDFRVPINEQVDVGDDITHAVAKREAKDPDTISTTDFGFAIDYPQEQESSLFAILVPYLIMALILGGLFFLFMRQVQGTNNRALNFGKSKAKPVDPNAKKVTFEDVAGADEEKEELAEIVEFLKNPKKFIKMGARIPKGVLLIGPPGTGKTLLARAIAGEAGVPFLTISGSDFVEMYVGVGASRVRDLFEQAKKTAPSIIFIDEIDAVGRHRGSGLGGGHDEREQTLNQLLVEMDGFAVNEGVIIIAATNRPDILDPALLRPGRFDRQITVAHPDVKGREEILIVHSKGKPFDKTVDLAKLARLTPWFTGADLENILNEAAILAARKNAEKISMVDVKEAINRVQMGPEKKSRKVTEEDRKLVAYHEAGHAVAANALEGCDPVHIVTIIPRGKAGGYTQTLSEDDSRYVTKSKIQDYIAMSLGGYVAEKLIFNDVTTGSTSDLKAATENARKMITEYGMSDDIGPIYLASAPEIMIGRDIGHSKIYSEKLAAQIDNEISSIIETAKKRTENILTENNKALNAVARALLKKEKIDGAEFRRIVKRNLPKTPELKPVEV
ncbi:MAG: ATP-dependent zinc metalloprotease FtsH [Clostridiales bacterium]|nr:ATP-dependent zinc metalloprotease FtsH [Clostridiales bacterium]